MPHPSPWVQIAAVSQDQPLALDTVVPTPGGTTTVGELRAGDRVFGSDGMPVTVMRSTPVLFGERCYRVTFSDGQSVVASARHGWTVERLSRGGREWATVTLTTEELTHRLDRGERMRVGYVAQQLPSKDDLPLDPYLMGLWLGDGTKRDATIACDIRLRGELETIIKPLIADHETIVWNEYAGNEATLRIRRRRGLCPRLHDYSADHYVSRAGHPVCRECARQRRAGRMDPAVPTFREKLRAAGVLNNKHIPQDYLNASVDQRWSLVQGLIDSDGGVDDSGMVTFTNTNPQLRRGLTRLLSSLGVHWREDGDLRVRFRCDPPAARLAHKVARQRPAARGEHRRRMVSTVTEVDSVPVRCIGIDTPDHLFLVGDRPVLTHNTRNTMTLLPGLLGTPSRAKALGVDLGKTIIYGPGSARLEAVTSNPRALEGSRPSMVILGETHHWLPSNDGREMARAVARNLAKSRDGSARALAITNAHAPGENSVAEADFEAWLDIDSGKSRASGVLYDSLAAPADLDLADPVALRAGIKAASGDSWWIDANRIAEEVLDPTTPVSMSRRFYLNQIVAPEDAWISAQEWDRCQIGAQLNPGDMVTLGFDGSRKDDATALVACRVTDGLLVRLGVWVAPPNVTDWEVDRDEVDAAVRSACDVYDVAGFYADLALWESYIDGWRDTVATAVRVKACGHHPLAFDMRGRRADFTRAADRFVSDVQQRQLMHDGDRTLRQHVLNARRAPNRWGVSIRKEAPMSQRKIDAAVASVLAWAARNDVVANGGASSSTKRRPGRVKAFS